MHRAAFAVSASATLDHLRAEDLVWGIASRLPDVTDTLPESIQLFPPGKYSISATRMESGDPVALQGTVDANLADLIRKDFQAFKASAAQGQGPQPFFDFNHEDREASGWPTEIYWGGDDPVTGGIRAKLEWTTPGGQAVKGKAYRQFSPNFRVSKDTGLIVGTTPNMGGLVNRPAFRGIAPLFAKHGGPDKQPKSMKKLHEALIAAGLLSVLPSDDEAATQDFSTRWQGVSAKLTRLPGLEKSVTDLTDTVKAKEATIAQKEELLKAKDTEVGASNQRFAELTVAQAVTDGVLAPKDEAGQKRWLTVLAKDPTQADLLKTFNASARGGGPGDLGKTVVPNGEGKAGDAAKPGANDNAFTAKAKEIKARDKVDDNQAMVTAAKENPELYKTYRDGLIYAKAV